MEVGALVELKSGGPIMTVIDISDDGHVTCRYHNSDGGFITQVVPALALRVVPDNDPRLG